MDFIEFGKAEKDIVNLTNRVVALESEEQELINPDSMSLYKTSLPITRKDSKYLHIMAGIDSHTAGSSGESYRNYFAPRMRGELGVGGTGYVPFYNSGVDEFGTVTASGVSLIKDLTPGQGYANYSLDNKGFYIDTPNGTESVRHDLSLSVYEKVDVIYLKQPNGGTFDVFYSANATNSKVTIDTNNPTAELGVVQLPYKRGASGVTINNMINGKICVFAMFLKCDSGFIYSLIGKGGDKLQWHNATSATFRQKWLEILKPDSFIFIGGTNDASDLNKDQYAQALNTYLQPYISTNTHLFIGRPCPRRGGEDRMMEYETELKKYAIEKKTEYLNIRELFGGDFASSELNGYVVADGVHSSARGCRKVANELLTLFNVPKVGTSYGNRVYQEPIQYIYPLTVKRFTENQNGTKEIYKLGFRPVNSFGYLELLISVYHASTFGYTVKKVNLGFTTSGSLNSCSGYSNMVETIIYSAKTGSNLDVNFNVTAEVVDGLLSIKVTPTNANVNIVCSGNAHFRLTQEGRSVWDHV